MRMPYIDADSPQVDFINTFGGYNHNNYISDGEFYDMQNMTCDDYPLASTRDKRGTHSLKMNGQDLDIIGMCGKDNINVLYKESPTTATTVVADATIEAKEYKPFIKIVNPTTLQKEYYCPCDLVKQGSFGEFFNFAETHFVNTQSHLDIYFYAVTKDDTTKICRANYQLAEFSTHPNRYIPPHTSASEITKFGIDYDGIGYQYAFSDAHIVGFVLREYISATGGVNPTYDISTQKMTIHPLSWFTFAGESDFQSKFEAQISNGIYVYVKYEDSEIDRNSEMYGPYKVSSFSDDTETMIIENTDTSNFTLAELKEKMGDGYKRNFTLSISLGETDVNFEWESGSNVEYVQFDVADKTPLSSLSANDKFYIEENEVKMSDLSFGGANRIAILKPSPEIHNGDKITLTSKKVKIASFDLATNTYSHATDVCQYQTGEHKVFEMGAYILLFPEKKQINTAKKSASAYTEIKDLEKVQSFINYRLCYQDGTDLTVGNTGASPSSTTDGYVWLDSSSTPRVLKIYNATLGSWSEIQPYIDFYTAPQTELVIDTYDSVDMDFGTYLETRIYREDGVHTYPVAEADLYRGNVSGYKNKSYIRIPVILNGIWNANNSSGSLQGSASKRIPKFDYLTVCNNRLWGCRFGENNYGDFVNEVFASKLGDAGNFNYLAGTSMDSFYMSMSDDGAFTGAYTYNSQPIFFRTDKIHRITGYLPENYQLITNDGYGCAKGSADSIVAMNNVIYYLSKVGVMAYGGDIPVSMSDAFGSVAYHNAISGTIGNKYYICMKDSSNVPTLFVYDDAKTMWHKEDNLDVKQFLQFENECYAWVGGNLIATGGLTGTKESNFPFMFQTGEIGYGTPYKKRLLKMTIRAKLPIGSRARIDIQYNGDGSWHRVTEIKSRNNVDSMAIPVSPYRCDHFSLRVVGDGEIKILSIAKFYTEGSDIQ